MFLKMFRKKFLLAQLISIFLPSIVHEGVNAQSKWLGSLKGTDCEDNFQEMITSKSFNSLRYYPLLTLSRYHVTKANYIKTDLFTGEKRLVTSSEEDVGKITFPKFNGYTEYVYDYDPVLKSRLGILISKKVPSDEVDKEYLITRIMETNQIRKGFFVDIPSENIELRKEEHYRDKRSPIKPTYRIEEQSFYNQTYGQDMPQVKIPREKEERLIFSMKSLDKSKSLMGSYKTYAAWRESDRISEDTGKFKVQSKDGSWNTFGKYIAKRAKFNCINSNKLELKVYILGSLFKDGIDYRDSTVLERPAQAVLINELILESNTEKKEKNIQSF